MTTRPDLKQHDDVRPWPVRPVIDWLVTEGRLTVHSARLLGDLCRRLLDAGAPLWRVRLSCDALHPQVQGWHCIWWRDADKTQAFQTGLGIRQTPAYVNSPISQVRETGRAVRYRLDRLRSQDHSLLHDLAHAGGTDYIALPMRFAHHPHPSVLILATDRPGGFSDADIRNFEELVKYLTPVVEVVWNWRLAESVLDTYVGGRRGRKVLQGQIKRGDNDVVKAVIWFSDLRSYTTLTESLAPDRMLALLNAYFENVAAAATGRGGEILRFVGDAMLIVFPTGPSGTLERACRAAMDAAMDAFKRVAALNRRRRQSGDPPIRFGIGLDSGDVICGNVGAPDRLDFTVQGLAVNRAARLEALTKTLDVPLLMSNSVASHVKRPVRSMGRHAMRGFAEPQEAFALAQHVADRSPSDSGPGRRGKRHAAGHARTLGAAGRPTQAHQNISTDAVERHA